MHIVVCVKPVPNPEIAPSVFRLDEEAKKIALLPGVSLVINPFDEQAVEAALCIRENSEDSDTVSITVLTMGENSSKKVIKHALALGVDKGVTLENSAFENSDSYAIAHALAAAIQKLDPVDLVLAGRQAVDTDAGIVGLGIAEILKLPAITLAKDIKMSGNEINVDRAVGDGTETMTTKLPAVVTVAHEFGAVRHPNLRETMRANKKPIETWGPEDIGVEIGSMGQVGLRRVVERIYQPVRKVDCEWLTGDDPTAVAKILAAKLAEEKFI